MELVGEPRSIAEMEFAASMFPCEVCGGRGPLAFTTGGSGSVWVVRGTCSRCSRERAFVFTTARDLFAVEHRDLELGPEQPSQLLAPDVLLGEIDRLVPTIAVHPDRLEGAAWSANFEVLDRVRTALNELEKFIPPGEVSMPATAHRDAAGAADQSARPERYTRRWIADERTRWNAVAQLFAADAPRILAADPILSRATRPRGRINADSLAAHRAWLARGGHGNGRLDVVTCDAEDMALVGVELTQARLEGVLLRRADLRQAWLDDVTLVELDLRGARLGGASLLRASLQQCRFDGANFVTARLDHVVMTGGSCERARLEHTRWRSSIVQGVSFRGAVFQSARFGDARFTACDLRGVDFTGADLSGAVFSGCAFAGAHGAPSAHAGLVVVDADLSGPADGSDLGGVEDLLAVLAE